MCTGQKFYAPFIFFCHFCMFLRSLICVFVHTVCMCLRKKSPGGLVEEGAGARQNGLMFIFCCSSRSDYKDADAHVDQELCWLYVFLDDVPIFNLSLFSTVKSKRPWSDCTDAHADLDLSLSDICWASLNIGISFKASFRKKTTTKKKKNTKKKKKKKKKKKTKKKQQQQQQQKTTLTGPYFTNVNLLQRLNSNCAQTCLYNFDPLKPHFYVVKLGFTLIYIVFLIAAQIKDCGYSLEPPRQGGSNEYQQSMVWEEIWKKKSDRFIWKFSFLMVKFSVHLNRRVS